jgi:hypothetical protein
MKRQGKRVDALEKLLVSAYRDVGEVHPSSGWDEAVLARIRTLGPIESAVNGQALVGRFVWRFAAAASLVAIVLLVYLFSSGVVDYQDLAVRFLENPIDFLI